MSDIKGDLGLDLMTDRSTSIAFFTLVLFASTWYYIWKVKQQANQSSAKHDTHL